MVRITSRFFHLLLPALCCLALCSIALIAEEKPPKKKAPPSPEKKEQGKKADVEEAGDSQEGVVLSGHLSRG